MAHTINVTSYFPYPVLLQTHAPGCDPTYETLQPFIEQLNANATSVPSTGGDGRLGHLFITIGDAAYTLLSNGNVPFVPPANPGPFVPLHGGTAAATSEHRAQYTESQRLFSTYQGTDAALTQQILTATDPKFVSSLRHRTYGFATVSTRQLVEHLLTTYAKITANDLMLNDERMTTPWQVDSPFETLTTQIDDGAAFADSGTVPFTDKQLVKIAYKLVYDSGPQLSLACRDWRAKPEADKTWINFQVFFKEAHRDISPDATAHNQGFAGYSTFITADEAAEAAEIHLANMANTQATSTAQVVALTEMLRQMQQKLDTILAGNVPKAPSAPNQRPPRRKTRNFPCTLQQGKTLLPYPWHLHQGRPQQLQLYEKRTKSCRLSDVRQSSRRQGCS
jgi:hypothetical protein